MVKVAALVTIALFLGQGDANEISRSKSELLEKILNHDPMPESQERFSDVPLKRKPFDETLILTTKPELQLLRGNGEFPSLAFVQAGDPERAGGGSLFYDSNFSPAILVDDGEGWETILDSSYEGRHWVYASRSTDWKRIWAIWDNFVQGPGPELTVIRSDDGGRTWQHVINIRKPYWYSRLSDATFDMNGHATLTINVFDTGAMGASPPMAVRCITRTTDDGKTWSNYEFEWDVVRDGGMIRGYPDRTFRH